MMAVDPFSVDTGFPTDYSGTVVDAWFAKPDDERRGTNLNMVWKMQLDDPAQFPQADGGVWEESFGCGENWETPDGGDTAVFPGNVDKRFHANSGYGKVVAKAVDDFKLRELLSSRGASVKEAKIWKGLRFHIDAEPYKFKDRGGEERSGKKNYPTEYLGEGEGGGYVAADAAGYSAQDLGVEADNFTILEVSAASAADWNSFLKSVVNLDWVKENDRLVMALAEEGFYKFLRGDEVI
jgi:hypothetical protein